MKKTYIQPKTGLIELHLHGMIALSIDYSQTPTSDDLDAESKGEDLVEYLWD